MALYSTYNQVGQAEDVSDVISNISPTKTPFVSSLGTSPVYARLYEWQEDSLAAAAANAKVEGFTAADATLVATVMRSNYTQIMEKTIKVSGSSDAVKTYGRKKETAYQLAKAMAEVKRDLEHNLIGIAQNAAVGDATSVARKFGNVFGNDVGTNPLIATGVSEDAGTAAPLTETMVLNVMQKVYNAGGDVDIFMIKPADSLIVADFAKVSQTRIRDFGTGTKLVNAVNVYVSPFGEVKVVLNRFIKTDKALVYSPDNWKLAVLRPWTRTMLAKTGDNESHMIVGEFGLKHNNFSASGQIFDLA